MPTCASSTVTADELDAYRTVLALRVIQDKRPYERLEDALRRFRCHVVLRQAGLSDAAADGESEGKTSEERVNDAKVEIEQIDVELLLLKQKVEQLEQANKEGSKTSDASQAGLGPAASVVIAGKGGMGKGKKAALTGVKQAKGKERATEKNAKLLDSHRLHQARSSHPRTPSAASSLPFQAPLPEDSSAIRCICASDNDDGFSIQCERCFAWLHARCVDISPDSIPEVYVCPLCSATGSVHGRDGGLPENTNLDRPLRMPFVAATSAQTDGINRRLGILSGIHYLQHTASDNLMSASEALIRCQRHLLHVFRWFRCFLSAGHQDDRANDTAIDRISKESFQGHASVFLTALHLGITLVDGYLVTDTLVNGEAVADTLKEITVELGSIVTCSLELLVSTCLEVYTFIPEGRAQFSIPQADTRNETVTLLICLADLSGLGLPASPAARALQPALRHYLQLALLRSIQAQLEQLSSLAGRRPSHASVEARVSRLLDRAAAEEALAWLSDLLLEITSSDNALADGEGDSYLPMRLIEHAQHRELLAVLAAVLAQEQLRGGEDVRELDEGGISSQVMDAVLEVALRLGPHVVNDVLACVLENGST